MDLTGGSLGGLGNGKMVALKRVAVCGLISGRMSMTSGVPQRSDWDKNYLNFCQGCGQRDSVHSQQVCG